MKNLFGFTGMLCGILAFGLIWGFSGCWIDFLSILGIVFGMIGITGDDSKVMGVVGLIFGIIGLILGMELYIYTHGSYYQPLLTPNSLSPK
ncbi:MAG: hypothetical protein ACFE94_15300 [Candidatus Hodarchaeota archaeon]